MLYATRWQIRINQPMNIVEFMGFIDENLNPKAKEKNIRVLLQIAIEIVEKTQSIGGNINSSKPPKRPEEFVYFEVIFKNYTDLQKLIKELSN